MHLQFMSFSAFSLDYRVLCNTYILHSFFFLDTMLIHSYPLWTKRKFEMGIFPFMIYIWCLFMPKTLIRFHILGNRVLNDWPRSWSRILATTRKPCEQSSIFYIQQQLDIAHRMVINQWFENRLCNLMYIISDFNTCFTSQGIWSWTCISFEQQCDTKWSVLDRFKSNTSTVFYSWATL